MAIPDLTAIRDWCVGKFQPKGDYALTSSIPTATSQLANDSEYVDQTSLNLSLAGKANNAYSNSIVNGYDYETGTVSVGSNVGNTISNSIASHDNALNDIISGVISNKEKITNLGGFTPVIDETTGEITGYKTAIGGADTVFPFSSGTETQINGIIKEYYASTSGNITAGDFVTFVNEVKETSSARLYTNDSENTIFAHMLSENNVLLIVREIESTASSSYTINYYGYVCTVEDGSVEIGNITELVMGFTMTSTMWGYATAPLKVVQMTDGKIILIYGGGTSLYLYAKVCTIEGTVITCGETLQLSTVVRTGAVIDAVKLSEEKIFIAHSYNTTKLLYGIVCAISGTTITKGTDTAIQTTSSSVAGEYIKVAMLSNIKIVIVHCYGSSYYLYGIVCVISGTTIIKGTDTKLSATTYMGYLHSIFVPNEDVVIICHQHSSDNFNYIMLCTVTDDTTITAIQDKYYTSNYNQDKSNYNTVTTCNPDYFFKLSDKKILGVYQIQNISKVDPDISFSLCGIVFKLGVNLERESEIIFSEYNQYKYSTFWLSDGGKMYVIYKDAETTRSVYELMVGKVSSIDDTILGIAKTNPDSDGKLKVYVPEIQKE